MKLKKFDTADFVNIELTQNEVNPRLTHHTGYILVNEENKLNFFSLEVGRVMVVAYAEILSIIESSKQITKNQEASLILLAEEYPYLKNEEYADLNRLESLAGADFTSVSEKKMEEAFEKETQFFADSSILPTSVKFYSKELLNYVGVQISFSPQPFEQYEIVDECVERAFKEYKETFKEWINWHNCRCTTHPFVKVICFDDMAYKIEFIDFKRIGLSVTIEINVLLDNMPLGVMHSLVQNFEKENARFLNCVWRDSAEFLKERVTREVLPV